MSPKPTRKELGRLLQNIEKNTALLRALVLPTDALKPKVASKASKAKAAPKRKAASNLNETPDEKRKRMTAMAKRILQTMVENVEDVRRQGIRELDKDARVWLLTKLEGSTDNKNSSQLLEEIFSIVDDRKQAAEAARDGGRQRTGKTTGRKHAAPVDSGTGDGPGATANEDGDELDAEGSTDSHNA
ncbi:hypothetical protein B0H14DRAFT_251947 [Mycena olivaceomarginata]|nr:hypothetical protein B0H14DRAFT_251947 [Mycena olivaceomarginata]